MSQYQLIALDLDGTLLNSQKQVPAESALLIDEITKAGKTVVFCTGRAVTELTDYYDALPGIRYAVFASGAGLYDIKERRAFSFRAIPREQAEEILALAKTKDVMPQIVLADRDVIQKSHMDALEHFHMGLYRPLYEKAMTLVPDIYAFAEECREDFLKINLYHAVPLEREKTRSQLSHLRMEKAYSEVSSLECSALGVDKGTGLLRLCGALGIDATVCVAVGDADNDIPMIRTAGLGVAMGNAAEHVRAAAKWVVKDLDHGGCAQALRIMLD